MLNGSRGNQRIWNQETVTEEVVLQELGCAIAHSVGQV